MRDPWTQKHWGRAGWTLGFLTLWLSQDALSSQTGTWTQAICTSAHKWAEPGMRLWGEEDMEKRKRRGN